MDDTNRCALWCIYILEAFHYLKKACRLLQEEHTISKLQRALKANRRLQGRLVGILEAIDGAIWSNAEMQAKLMHNSQQHPRAGRYKGMRGALASVQINSGSMPASGAS